MMKTVVRLLTTVPLVMVLASCMDSTVPRLPTDNKEETDTTRDNTGYLGEAPQPFVLG